MSRVELLDIVKSNKEKHIKDFNEAVVDYKALVVKVTTANNKLAKTGDLVEIRKIKAVPAEPNSYENNYAKAIRMLELSVEDIIDIEEDVFNQLVLDEWDWKHRFTVSNASYKAGY
jgi:hypothetical protein